MADITTTYQLNFTGDQINDLLTRINNLDTELNNYLLKNGGTMTGAINMNGQNISGLSEPTEDFHAVPKFYADNIANIADSAKNTADSALPKSGGTMTGPITMSGNKVTGLGAPTGNADAATKSYVDTAVSKAAPYNLLDNSYFRNPVNQRGLTSVTPGTDKTYFIDRWCAARTKVSVTADGVMVAWDGKNDTVGYIQQKLSGNWNAGDTYTVAAKIDGGVVCGSFALPTNGAQATVQQHSDVAITVSYLNDVLYYSINTSRAAGILVEWAALYEGEYTSETLPEYRPKRCAAELAECQRYCYIVSGASNVAFPGMLFDAKTVRMSIRLPVKMRVNPTVTVENISKLDTYTTGGAVIPTAYTAVTAGNNQFIVLNLTVPSGKTVGTPTVTRVNTIIKISADL